jgi:hypothetical protein
MAILIAVNIAQSNDQSDHQMSKYQETRKSGKTIARGWVDPKFAVSLWPGC